MSRARLYEAFQVLDSGNSRDVFVPAASITVSVCQLGTTTPVTYPIYTTATGSTTAGPSNITVSSPYTLELFTAYPDRVTLTVTVSGSATTQTSSFVPPENEGVDRFNPKFFGAKFDAKFVGDGVVGSGSSALQSATAVFSSAVVGRRVVVEGGASTATYLQTTVASRQSAIQVTLAKAATKTVSGATFYIHGRAYSDGAMTAGSAILTSATAAFVVGDVGAGGFVTVAGAFTLPLCTTISAYVSATQVTLAANASTSITGAGVWYGTDDSAAIQAAIDAAALAGGGGATDGGGTCYPPLGRAMVATGIVCGGQSTSLYGVGAFADPDPTLTQFGTTLIAATQDMTVLTIAGNRNEVKGLAIHGGFKAAQFGVALGSASHALNHDGLHEMIQVVSCQTGVLLDYEQYGTTLRKWNIQHNINGVVAQESGAVANQKVYFDGCAVEQNVTGGTFTACELYAFENGTCQFNATGGFTITNCRQFDILKNQFEGTGQFAINLAKPNDTSSTNALVGGLIAGNMFIGGNASFQVGIQSNGADSVTIGANTFKDFGGTSGGALNFTLAAGGVLNSNNVFMPYQRIESSGTTTIGVMNGIDYGWAVIVGDPAKLVLSNEHAYADGVTRLADVAFRAINSVGAVKEVGRLRANLTPHSGETNPRVALELHTVGVSGTETVSVTVPEDGGLVVGRGAALATNSTTGMIWVPYCQGTPTGAPTDYTALGAVPMVIDSTNSKIYVRIGGSWKGVTVA
jgi:hypothetical protein